MPSGCTPLSSTSETFLSMNRRVAAVCPARVMETLKTVCEVHPYSALLP